MRSRILPPAFFAFLFLVGTVHAITVVQEAILRARDGASGDRFGGIVDISRNIAVVGAVNDDDLGTDSGSVYVFQRGSRAWHQLAKLNASDGTAFDQFGTAAISGDTIVVGARLDAPLGAESGSAYVFERQGSQWQEMAKLTASDGAIFDQFGQSTAISGDTIVVGAWLDDDKGNNSGSAYIFQGSGSNWVEVAKLTPNDGAAEDIFGLRVAIHNHFVIVGSRLDDDLGSDSGAAYIFQRSGQIWMQTAKLTATDGTALDNFGNSVDIDGDWAVVGAFLDDDLGVDSGSVYVFQRNGSSWLQVTKLTASDGAAGDLFGLDVAVEGDKILVGAIFDDDKGVDSGSVYIFENSGQDWNQVAKITASNGTQTDNFGTRVGISGDTVVVGAPFGTGRVVDSGTAYIFRLR